jgi:hypothetical protein
MLNLQGHPISAVNIFSATLHIWILFPYLKPEDLPCYGDKGLLLSLGQLNTQANIHGWNKRKLIPTLLNKALPHEDIWGSWGTDPCIFNLNTRWR